MYQIAQHEGKLLTCHHSVVHTLLVGCNLSLHEVKLGHSDLDNDITLCHPAGYLIMTKKQCFFLFIFERLCISVIKKTWSLSELNCEALSVSLYQIILKLITMCRDGDDDDHHHHILHILQEVVGFYYLPTNV